MSNITKWLWPVKGTKVGDVTPQRWYTGPHSQGLHSGIDVFTLDIDDNDVVASRDGTVVMIMSGCNNNDGLGDGGEDCGISKGCTAKTTKHEYKNSLGQVVSTRWFCNQGVGNMVVLEHDVKTDSGTIIKRYSQYCHLKTICVELYQTVDQGEKIGTVGSTGESTDPHLHFSISTGYSYWGRDRINNNPYDIDSPYEPGEFEYFEEIPTPTEKVKVSFYDDLPENGGKHMANKDTEYTVGGKYGSFPDPGTKTGYTFESWYYPSGDGYGFVKTYSDVTKDITKLYAHWVPDTVEVTFYDDLEGNGGEAVKKRNYLVGLTYGAEYDTDEKYKTFPDPTEFNKEGYNFDKWYTKTGGFVEHYSVVTRDRTELYAHWTPKTYGLTLYPGYGTNVQLGGTYTVTTENAYGAALPTLTRCGYTHIGWKRSDVNGDTTVYDSKSTVTKEITKFTAIWEAERMNVTIDNNIDGMSNTTYSSVPFGKNYSDMINAEEQMIAYGATKGMDFEGWHIPESSDSTVAYVGDHTMKAMWKPKKVTLTFESGPDCGFAESLEDVAVTVKYGENYGYLPVPKSDKLYEFAYWAYVDSEGNMVICDPDTPVEIIEDAKTLTAYWNTRTFVKYIYIDSEGKRCERSNSVEYGKPYVGVPELSEKTGYDAKWVFAGEETVISPYDGAQFFPGMLALPEYPKTIKADYTAKLVRVTYDYCGGIDIDGNGYNIVNLRYNTTYGSQIFEKSGYTFTGWYYDEACTQPVGSTDVITNPEPHTIYAGWKKNITLTFDPGESTFAEAVEPKTVYLGEPYGDLPVPACGDPYIFAYWSLFDESGNELDYILSDKIVGIEEDHTVVAIWRKFRELNLDPNGGTVSMSYRNAHFGRAYPLLPTPMREGYEFVGWFFGDDTAYAGVQCTKELTVLPEHPDTVYAMWEEVTDTETE